MRLYDDPPIPKYWQLADQLRQMVVRGELKPGDRLPSLAEMREDHNLSRPTVEKAHALLEKEGLIIRQHGAGVFVAEPRKKPVKGVIGLCGQGFSFIGYSPYWAQLLGGVREAASQAGMQLMMLDSHTRKGWEKADGVIICDWDAKYHRGKRPLEQPTVALMFVADGEAAVFPDEYQGTAVATEHLLKLGHKRIAFLYSEGDQPVIRKRLSAYRDTLKAAGITPRRTWQKQTLGSFTYGNQIVRVARKSMAAWLKEGWSDTGCTALLCHNDETAYGAIQALQAQGLRVPEDVSVVGFDGTEFCDLVTPAITSVEVPLRAIGAAGVELLLKQIKADQLSDEHRVFSLKVCERASTAAPEK